MKYQQHLNKVLRTQADHNLPESHSHHHDNGFPSHVLNRPVRKGCRPDSLHCVLASYHKCIRVATIFIIIILMAPQYPFVSRHHNLQNYSPTVGHRAFIQYSLVEITLQMSSFSAQSSWFLLNGMPRTKEKFP